jgi:hypothetical protein
MFASKITLALPIIFPVEIFLIKAGMSIPVGQAEIQGAS